MCNKNNIFVISFHYNNKIGQSKFKTQNCSSTINDIIIYKNQFID